MGRETDVADVAGPPDPVLAASLAGLEALYPADPEAVRPDPDEVGDLCLLVRTQMVSRLRRGGGVAAPPAASDACAALGLVLQPADAAFVPVGHPLDLARRLAGRVAVAPSGGPSGASSVVGASGDVGGRALRALGWAGSVGPADPLAVAVLDAADVDDATVQAAVNAACWVSAADDPLPLLLVVADAGAPGPAGWVRSLFDGRLGLEYLSVDAADPLGLLAAARWACDTVRTRRCPVAVHLVADPGTDPLVAAVRALVRRGVLDAAGVAEQWRQAAEAADVEVVAGRREPAAWGPDGALADAVAARVAVAADRQQRLAGFAGALPEDAGPIGVPAGIRAALTDAALSDPRLVEIVAPASAPDSDPSPSTSPPVAAIRARVVPGDVVVRLGVALGAREAGDVPVLTLTSPAELVWAAALLRGQRAGGVVLRVPVAAGEEVPLAVLRDVADVLVACPAHPSDAPGLLRTCLAAAAVAGAVAVLVEPLDAGDPDMFTPGDGAWAAPYPPPQRWAMTHVPVGRAAAWVSGEDATVVTAGPGVRAALRAAAGLASAGVRVRVVDLRWLQPLPVADVVREAVGSGRLLVVEPFAGSGLAPALLTAALEADVRGRLAWVAAGVPTAGITAALGALLGA